MNCSRYPSNLTDEQWSIVEPLLPLRKRRGRRRRISLRSAIDAIFYLLRTGCQWRQLPRDFPAMAKIAEETGIGRATLYKYFPDVEAILVAWHERQVAGHLEHLIAIRDQAGDASERLEAVLEAYAFISHEHHGTELAARLHRGEHVARAQQQLSDFIRDLLAEGAKTGGFRDDIAPDELATYCLHALAAASTLPSQAAVRRLVTVTLAGLRPPR